MLDAYETQSMNFVQTKFHVGHDALLRAGAHLNDEDLQRDDWAYCYMQLCKALKAIEAAKDRVVGVRTRRLDGHLPGGSNHAS